MSAKFPKMMSKIAPKGGATTPETKGVIKTIQKQKEGPRKYIFSHFVQGKVDQWTGTFGWIIADKKIVHEAATKSKGRIYCGTDSLEKGQSIKKGARVQCKVFVNKQGMRADSIRVIKGG